MDSYLERLRRDLEDAIAGLPRTPWRQPHRGNGIPRKFSSIFFLHMVSDSEFASLANLFRMVGTVHPVKLAPLTGGEWT